MSNEIMELTRAVKNILSATSQQLAGMYISFDRLNVATMVDDLKGTGVGEHQDDEEEHGNDIIVSISFGSPAVFKWRQSKNEVSNSITLEHGDLVIFDRWRWHEVIRQEDTDQNWNRLNITFRIFNVPCYGWKGEKKWAPAVDTQESDARGPAKKAKSGVTASVPSSRARIHGKEQKVSGSDPYRSSGSRTTSARRTD